jgi:hypothetical protein
MTRINFVDDLPAIRKFIGTRVRSQSRVKEPVSGIVVGFQLNQAGLLVFYFDTNEKFEQDGSWTLQLGGPVLELPHWQTAYESADDEATSFVMPNGEPREVSAGAGDAAVAGVFGEALFAITLDAVARGAFAQLPLLANCQLDFEEFDGMWGWPPRYEDHGKTNVLRNLPAVRLPL